MCTVTWVHSGDAYELLSSRDEKLSRPPASAPQVQSRGGMRFLAPVDTAHGGTWIGVNEVGLALCLLNGEPAAETVRDPRSRGLVLPELLGAVTVMEAARRFWEMDLRRFAPFALAALEPGLPAAYLQWRGGERSVLLRADPYLPLSSSSFDDAGVRRARRREFRRRVREAGGVSVNVLERFHLSHACGGGAYAPCMHRADARTVSLSRVRVNGGSAEFHYSPGAPCEGAGAIRGVLPLRQ